MPARASRLVVALGNSLAGDDGVAACVLRHLASADVLDADVELLDAGPDLLACGPALGGRAVIVLVDAAAGLVAGAVRRVADDESALELAQPGAHALSAPAALALLRLADPTLARARCEWVLVGVESVTMGAPTGAATLAAVPAAADAVLAALGD